MNIFNWFKKRRNLTISPNGIYSLENSNGDNILSQSDLKMISFFLNFQPSLNNLKCRVNRYDKYTEYVENVDVHIFCQLVSNEWNYLDSAMLNIFDFLSQTKTNEPDSFKDFLNLIHADEEKSYTDNEIIKMTIAFINDYKLNFQTQCESNNEIYIDTYSAVNDFKIIWGTSEYMNFIFKSQG